MSKLKDAIGKIKLHHSAHMVQGGHLKEALTLFMEELEFVEVDEPFIGEGFEVRCVQTDDDPDVTRVQLTHHDGETFEEPLRGAHIGLSVADPKKAAGEILLYAMEKGWDAKIEPVNPEETKFWVTIPEILAFKIELVLA